MNLVIMQPYFLPYLGYCQLLHACDVFVVYDDVQFIKGGWINRNRYLVNGQATFFNLATIGASPNKRINEIQLDSSFIWRNKLLRGFDNSYAKNVPYQEFRDCLIRILFHDAENLSDYLFHSIQQLNSYLGLNKMLLRSSEKWPDDSIGGKERVLAICNRLQAQNYINAPGGVELYDKNEFKENGLNLKFLHPILEPYYQNNSAFVNGLSILDIIAFNPKSRVSELLKNYSLE